MKSLSHDPKSQMLLRLASHIQTARFTSVVEMEQWQITFKKIIAIKRSQCASASHNGSNDSRSRATGPFQEYSVALETLPSPSIRHTHQIFRGQTEAVMFPYTIISSPLHKLVTCSSVHALIQAISDYNVDLGLLFWCSHTLLRDTSRVKHNTEGRLFKSLLATTNQMSPNQRGCLR